jgi:D-aminoacyl-tRNA deacylase
MRRRRRRPPRAGENPVKVLVQRVARASVTVSGRVVASIADGLLLFVGVEAGDGPEQARAAAAKMATLRVFPDGEGRMNLDVSERGGSVLVVSQFTLAGSIRKGRRPSFDGAAAPDLARPLVELVASELRARGLSVGEGIFGADMKVDLLNDGPVTFLLELPPGTPAAGASA